MIIRQNNYRLKAGVSLIEAIIYISLFVFLLGCSTRYFNIVYYHHKAVAKVTGYTTSALDAAKHWRRDIANAKTDPRLIRGDHFDVIKIDQAAGGQISYRLNRSTLERFNGEEWVPIIRRVNSSIMIPDQRENVRAWRWELALETKSQYIGDPLRFSFVAVPGHPLAPLPKKIQPPLEKEGSNQ